ncbi:MAG TPA: acyl-homoserine-lactone synthase [Rhizomicrobium sp.]
MIEVVTSRNAPLHGDALRQMYRLRHRILVERHGLERLRRQDGLLKDRFDTDAAIHLLLTDEDGALRGASRLVPTVGPHMLADVAPDFCAVRGVRRGDDIVELTRSCVDEEGLDAAAMETAQMHMVIGLFEFCVRAGYEKITTLMPTDSLCRHLANGIDIKPLGLAAERDGIDQVAVVVTADQDTLDALRLDFEVFEPLVRYAGAPSDDPLFLAPALISGHSLQAAE